MIVITVKLKAVIFYHTMQNYAYVLDSCKINCKTDLIHCVSYQVDLRINLRYLGSFGDLSVQPVIEKEQYILRVYVQHRLCYCVHPRSS